MNISHLLHQYWKKSYDASLILKEHTKYSSDRRTMSPRSRWIYSIPFSGRFLTNEIQFHTNEIQFHTNEIQLHTSEIQFHTSEIQFYTNEI